MIEGLGILITRLSAPTPLTIGDQVYTLPPPGEGPPGGPPPEGGPMIQESPPSTSEVQILDTTSEAIPEPVSASDAGSSGGGRGMFGWMWGNKSSNTSSSTDVKMASS